MMKKMFGCVAIALSLLALLPGCSSVQYAEKFNGMPIDDTGKVPKAHVNVKITGLYFLGFLPIISGSPASAGRCTGFTDTVNTENAVYMLTRNCRAIGGTKVIDIVSTRSDFSLLLLMSLRTVEVSGTTLSKR